MSAVAHTILKQLGGNRFITMTGAGDLVADANILSFKLPARFAKNGINYVQVKLEPSDLYTLAFFKFKDLKLTKVDAVYGLYANQLASVFTEKTGLHTSLGTMLRRCGAAV